MTVTPMEVNTASKAAVNFASRSRIRCVNRQPASCRSTARPRASWMAQSAVGDWVTPSRCTRRVPVLYDEGDVGAPQRHRAVHVKEIGGHIGRRGVRHDSSRWRGGGIRCVRRILRIVEAATRCPSRRSSPWIRTTPHVLFSVASRTISATRSSAIVGRPGDLGWVHLRATSRWCQRSSVPGVTRRDARTVLGSIRVNADSIARSVQPRRGFGFARRSTAISWRRASNSASFADDDRPNRASQDKTTPKQR